MKRYVLGFYLAPDGAVMILKSKPDWQRGKWNGIGGSIEEGETPIMAMVREFQEETTIATMYHAWQELFTLSGEMPGDPPKPWQMTVFMGQGTWCIGHRFPVEMDEGEVHLVTEIPEPIDSTAAWLLPMCWDLQRHQMQLACIHDKAPCVGLA